MATKTAYLQLEKPSESDYYDINVYNHNLEIVDGSLRAQSEQTALLKLELSSKGGGAKIGTAAEISALGAGELLFLTDDGAVEGQFVTLTELLAEGKKAAEGQSNRLSELAAVAVADGLNFRANATGARFSEDGAFCEKITALCVEALRNGTYLVDGAISLSWKQVQEFLITGNLPSASEAEEISRFWCADGSDRLATLEEEIRNLRAIIGDIHAVLDKINDTEVG